MLRSRASSIPGEGFQPHFPDLLFYQNFWRICLFSFGVLIQVKCCKSRHESTPAQTCLLTSFHRNLISSTVHQSRVDIRFPLPKETTYKFLCSPRSSNPQSNQLQVPRTLKDSIPPSLPAVCTSLVWTSTINVTRENESVTSSTPRHRSDVSDSPAGG